MYKSRSLEIIDIYIDDMKNYPLLTGEETEELLKRYKIDGDLTSFQRLVIHNLGLAFFKAGSFINNCSNLDFLDLIQENNLILMNAVRLFDINKGVKLSTYLGYAMEKSLQRNIDKIDKNMKLSVRFNSQRRKYSRYVQEYFRDNGVYPTRNQLIKHLKISDSFLEYIERESSFDTLSLNQKLPDNLDEELIDTVSYGEDVYLDVEREYDELILLRTLYNVLSVRDYYIIYNRIIKSPAKTQEEVGKDLELTRVRINQLESKALKKLKPIFEVIQRNGVVNPINKVVDDRMLVVIEPKLRTLLSFLKSNLAEDEYYIVYTKLCDSRNDNLKNYYKVIGSENLSNIIADMTNVIKEFTTLDKVEQIYGFYRQRLKIEKILELDVLPNKNIMLDSNFDILDSSICYSGFDEEVKSFVRRFSDRNVNSAESKK